jgi:hypothetical protein
VKLLSKKWILKGGSLKIYQIELGVNQENIINKINFSNNIFLFNPAWGF